MLIVVTNRKLCIDDFFQRLRQLAQGKPHAIMLREKDVPLTEFEDLALKVKDICEQYQVPLIINQNIAIASKLNLHNIHLSIEKARKYKNNVSSFRNIGVSVHSLEEAKEAQSLGASYLIAGHIYQTESKKGIQPRGLTFLQEICNTVSIPVFAIGGISKNRVKDIKKTGAKGVCIMSEAMTCLNPVELPDYFKF
jgi:thiamine-phosphate pyrophosphorylase